MPDDPEKIMQELRQRIATEGLPKLSPEPLRSYKREYRQSPKLAQPPSPKHALSLSQEARRLFIGKLTQSGLGGDDDRTRDDPVKLF
jgi:hypothetical protein